MSKKKDISKLDKQSWKEYIEDPKDIFDKELSVEKKTLSTKRYKFDLHGYSLAEANNKVTEIILKCADKDYSEILLITGKGIHSNTDNNTFVSKDLSKLRFSIPDFISSTNDLLSKVSSVSTASLREGGEGAIIIKLKKKIITI